MKKKKTKKQKEQRGSTSASRPLYREVPKHRDNCRKSHITSAGSGSKQKNKTAAVFCPESSCWPLVETQRDLLFSLLNFLLFFLSLLLEVSLSAAEQQQRQLNHRPSARSSEQQLVR